MCHHVGAVYTDGHWQHCMFWLIHNMAAIDTTALFVVHFRSFAFSHTRKQAHRHTDKAPSIRAATFDEAKLQKNVARSFCVSASVLGSMLT